MKVIQIPTKYKVKFKKNRLASKQDNVATFQHSKVLCIENRFTEDSDDM